jgi:hypothetical protein
MMNQQTAAANMQNQIEQNKLTAGQSLMSGGTNQLQGASGLADKGISAAGAGLNSAGQYAGILSGLQGLGQANFQGTQGVNTGAGTNTQSTGVNILPQLSDVHAKEKIVYVGRRNGHKIYDFNYRGQPGRYRGVMAQEIRQSRPEAVTQGSDGLLRVDYSQLGFEMEQLG